MSGNLRSRLVICSFRDAHKLVCSAAIGAVINIEHLNPDLENPVDGQGPRIGDRPQLVQCYKDLERWEFSWVGQEDNDLIPQKKHLVDALAFARKFLASDERKLLIHCYKGKARSCATALAILADAYGPGREEEAVSDLLAIRPEACPNLLMVELADEVLGRNGLLLKAVMNRPEIVRRRMESDRGRRSGMESYWREHPERRPGRAPGIQPLTLEIAA